jgi:hypothetical protein
VSARVRTVPAALGALLGFLFLPPCQPAHSADLDVPALVAACADLRNGARLSADKNLLCFDGEIRWDAPLAQFHALNRGGTLVVRSPGGLTVLAMRMADILREKNARVVIHDHCFSACANALFVATHETHVAEGALVAWHGNNWSQFACAPVPRRVKKQARNEEKRMIARYEEFCRDPVAFHEFYHRRGITPDFTVEPPTAYGQKKLRTLQRDTYYEPGIFWTWHPENFGSFFKSTIVFRSYPDQETFEARMLTLRSAARLIYDLPRGLPK